MIDLSNQAVLFSFSTTPVIQDGVTIFTDFLDSDVFTVDPNLRTPYIQNYNLNLQHELFRNGVLQVGYVGSNGTKLFRYRDINKPVNPTVSTARPFDNGPFAPSGGTFFYVNQLETTARSNYNALQTSFTLRNRRGWTTSINYSWSHSIDNASDGRWRRHKDLRPDPAAGKTRRYRCSHQKGLHERARRPACRTPSEPSCLTATAFRHIGIRWTKESPSSRASSG
jgi:hypothetical protein